MFRTFRFHPADLHQLSFLNRIPQNVPITHEPHGKVNRSANNIHDQLQEWGLSDMDRIHIHVWFSAKAVTIGKKFREAGRAIDAINSKEGAFLRLHKITVKEDRESGRLLSLTNMEKIVNGIADIHENPLDAILTIS
jgi:hypothetical protein